MKIAIVKRGRCASRVGFTASGRRRKGTGDHLLISGSEWGRPTSGRNADSKCVATRASPGFKGARTVTALVIAGRLIRGYGSLREETRHLRGQKLE